MRQFILRDQFRRKRSIKAEPKRIILNYFKSDFQFFSKKEMEVFNDCLEQFGKNTSCHRTVTRCLLTRRSRGVFKFFGLERRVLRYQFLNGRYSGIRRSVW